MFSISILAGKKKPIAEFIYIIASINSKSSDTNQSQMIVETLFPKK
jgi:hypothetical protein